MGLLEGESWEDYLNKDCYVTEDNGCSGYMGTVRDYNESFILIEDGGGDKHEVKSEHVFGTWILEDW